MCGNGAELSGAEMAGESANCGLLRDNIVMLDYPSACWHCPALLEPTTLLKSSQLLMVFFYRELLSAYGAA